jgi:hypothetical protein
MTTRTRPLGITALAFASVIVGIFCQVAAMALLLGGTLAGVAGTDMATALLVLGAVYLGLMVAAYFVGYGFWCKRHWSWAGGLVVFATLFVLSVFMLLLSANVLAVLLPGAGAAVAIWYLLRPEVREQLLGAGATGSTAIGEADAAASAPDSVPMEMPQALR